MANIFDDFDLDVQKTNGGVGVEPLSQGSACCTAFYCPSQWCLPWSQDMLCPSVAICP